jgi:hypothetical protein
MNLQEKMFKEVENWIDLGISKMKFLDDKTYSEAKFNYWLAKWKTLQSTDVHVGFREIGFSEVKLSKALEIEASSGVKKCFTAGRFPLSLSTQTTFLSN